MLTDAALEAMIDRHRAVLDIATANLQEIGHAVADAVLAWEHPSGAGYEANRATVPSAHRWDLGADGFLFALPRATLARVAERQGLATIAAALRGPGPTADALPLVVFAWPEAVLQWFGTAPAAVLTCPAAPAAAAADVADPAPRVNVARRGAA